MSISVLYHGTSEKCGRIALKEGLRPRGLAKGNWEHSIPSHKDAVYLTNSYAPYYAMCAADVRDKLGAVIEINIHNLKLNPFKFAPDEDALEQIGRDGMDKLPKSWEMKQRTLHYRNNLHKYSSMANAEKSLKLLGNCCYMGDIPAEAITRVALIPIEEFIMISDPTITLLNYHYMGNHYRALNEWIFTNELPKPEEGYDQLEQLRRFAACFDRRKITILSE